MSKGTSGWVTVLLRLPLFYNPDASGHREPVEDAKFLVTAEEIARRFGGGTLFVFRQDAPRGFWWAEGIVDQDVLSGRRRPRDHDEASVPRTNVACGFPALRSPAWLPARRRAAS